MRGKSTVLMSASAIALAAISVPAMAQSAQAEAPEVQADEIIVTGYARSLKDAIDAKRNAPSIVDSVAAEDMGKFPESNLAESLQRITGVQIQRNNGGDGGAVSVRGLDPSFNLVTLNGRSIPSAAGSRSFDFQILSGELISRLDVYKSPTSNLQEGGLAGTIDVRTLNPFDVNEQKFAINVEGMYQDIKKSVNPHVSGIYANSFADDRLHVVLGVDYSRRKVRTDQLLAFGLEAGQGATRFPPQNYVANDPNGTYYFNHAVYFIANEILRERKTGLLSVGYEISPNAKLWLEGLYSNFDETSEGPKSAVRFTNINVANSVVSSRVTPFGGGNLLSFMDVDNVDNRNSNGITNNSTTLQSYAAGLDLDSDRFHVKAQGSWGRSRTISNSLGAEVIARASASQTVATDGSIPILQFTRGYNEATPANWRLLGIGGAVDAPTTDLVWGGRIDATRDFGTGFFKNIQAGVQYESRERSFDNGQVQVSGALLGTLLNLPYSATIEGGSVPAGSIMSSVAVPNFLSAYKGPGASSLPNSFYGSDPRLVLGLISKEKLIEAGGIIRNLPAVFSVKEQAISGYARLNFESDDGSVKANLGARLVNTRQTSNGYAPDLSLITFSQQGAQTFIPGVTPATVKQSYTNFLPSANLIWETSPNLVLRASLARTMARSDLGFLSPATNVNANVRNITRGNPQLKPYTSDSVDLSGEYYTNGGGLVSVALFYKKIRNFVIQTQSNLTLNVTQTDGSGTLPIPFTVNQPNNGGSTSLKGAEISVQQKFQFLPAPFDGFGVFANYTYVDAGLVPFAQGQAPLPLTGASKHNYNIVGFYEKGPIGLRASYNYRSGYTIDNFLYFGDGAYAKSYRQLDVSGSLKVSEQIDLSASVTNLTNSLNQIVNRYNVAEQVIQFGRRYTVGVRAKL